MKSEIKEIDGVPVKGSPCGSRTEIRYDIPKFSIKSALHVPKRANSLFSDSRSLAREVSNGITPTNQSWFYCKNMTASPFHLHSIAKATGLLTLILGSGVFLNFGADLIDTLCNRTQVKWTCSYIFAIEPRLIGGVEGVTGL